METKDGFTFTRRAPNKQVTSCEGRPVHARRRVCPSGNAGADDEFVFNRVSRNPALKPDVRCLDEQPSIAKKRRTIQMEQSIDLSTDASLLQGDPECSAMDNVNARDKAGAGVPAQRPRSHEIHKRVLSNNINDLIKECIHFLKDDSDYAREIIKHCNSNYFSDIDYRKEIEVANTRGEHIRDEISKWSRIFLEEKALNAITIPEIASVEEMHDDSVPEADGRLVEEFEKKARRLLELEERLRYFFENAREKSDNLLKSIFGSLEEKSVDAIFLLKAMSRLGRDEQTMGLLQRARSFWRCSCNFVRESKRPSATEFKEILKGHLIGFIVPGLFAYVIKVIHIPINNMIVGSDKQ